MTSNKRVVQAAGTAPTPQCFGLYQGSVSNITDPLRQGRVQLYVPQVLGTAVSNWAKPLGNSSLVNPVTVGQYVFVMFIGGDRNQPVYLPMTWGVAPPSPNLALTGTLSVGGTSTLTGAVTANGGETVTGGATIDIVNRALTVYKTADTNRGSTSVLSDPDLQMTVAAGAVYTFDLILYVSGSGTGELQYMFSKPAGSSGTYSAVQYNLSGGLQSIISNLSTNNTASVNNPNSNGIVITGVLDNTGNPSGTFALQWGQNTNNGSTTVGQYSYMRLVRMA